MLGSWSIYISLGIFFFGFKVTFCFIQFPVCLHFFVFVAFLLGCSCQDIINPSSCFLPLLPYTVSCNEELSQLSPVPLQQHTHPQQHVPRLSLSLHNNVFANEMRTSTVPLFHFTQHCGRLMFSKEHFRRHLTLISFTRTVAPNVTDSWGFTLSCDHGFLTVHHSVELEFTTNLMHNFLFIQ
jgi:hypothetical protein